MLQDKVVVVTGGCGLIGREFIGAILRNAGRAVIADVDAERGERLLAELSSEYGAARAMFARTDICCENSLKETIDAVSGRFGRIDAVVNNAYPRNKQYGRKLEDVTYDSFCENVSLNLGGLFLTSKQFALYFQKHGGGQIVNIASIYGLVAPRFEVYRGTKMTMPVEYAAIKSAVIHLTKYFAKYFRGVNLRVNCLSPGGIEDRQPENFLIRYREFALNKGMLDARDLNGALLFLLSDQSSFVNGQNIVVDDGWSL